MKLSGWGRYPVIETALVSPGSIRPLALELAGEGRLVARGNGRAYGDAAIGANKTVSMLGWDRGIRLDADKRTIRVEAGMQLARLIALLLPRGLFPPVVPGTSYVTIGGMVASDVHGKNHHGHGSFGDHVRALRLMLPSGQVIECGPRQEAELFHATLGGMGLTGVILEVEFDLIAVETGWIRQRTVVAPDLARALATLRASDAATYSVAWIDCAARGAALGRSLVYVGEHASAAEAARDGKAAWPALARSNAAVPFDLPAITLNGLSVRAFNELYYRNGRRHAGAERLVDWRSYFFPLDSIAEWNRIYGRAGFVQFQAALPPEGTESGLGELLDAIARAGAGSFLAVLKLFGPARRAGSPLSFPRAGATLALDFPMRRGTPALMTVLEDIAVRHGGRLYLAKDAVQDRYTFEAGYPALDRFRALRRTLDPNRTLASAQSERLGLT